MTERMYYVWYEGTDTNMEVDGYLGIFRFFFTPGNGL